MYTVRIELASLDPEPYWEYGFRIQIRTVLGIRIPDPDLDPNSHNYVQKGKNLRFQVEKRITRFAEGLRFSTEPGSPLSIFSNS